MQKLTREDKKQVFIRATQCCSGAKTRWEERAEIGLSNIELEEALKYEIGTVGGSGGKNCLHTAYNGSGLRIWGSWETLRPQEMELVCSGQKTINLAREIYNIPNPEQAQQRLF